MSKEVNLVLSHTLLQGSWNNTDDLQNITIIYMFELAGVQHLGVFLRSSFWQSFLYSNFLEHLLALNCWLVPFLSPREMEKYVISFWSHKLLLTRPRVFCTEHLCLSVSWSVCLFLNIKLIDKVITWATLWFS